MFYLRGTHFLDQLLSVIALFCFPATGATSLPGHLSLNNVLVSPKFIKNFISVYQFTSDNYCSVKDLASQKVLIKCNSFGSLYPLQLQPALTFAATSAPALWHRRLGHPGHGVLAKIASVIPFCNTT